MNKGIYITEKIDFTFMLNSNPQGIKNENVARVLEMYYRYSVQGSKITIYDIEPMNIEFIVQLVNGIN